MLKGCAERGAGLERGPGPSSATNQRDSFGKLQITPKGLHYNFFLLVNTKTRTSMPLKTSGLATPRWSMLSDWLYLRSTLLCHPVTNGVKDTRHRVRFPGWECLFTSISEKETSTFWISCLRDIQHTAGGTSDLIDNVQGAGHRVKTTLHRVSRQGVLHTGVHA